MSLRRRHLTADQPIRSRRTRHSRRAAAAAAAGTCVTALVLIPAGAAFAATDLFVDPASGCSDTGGGTSGQPFCTISAAAKTAVSGDTVHVADGTYPEQVTATSGVSFVAASHNAVVLGSTSLAGAVWTATSSTAWTTPLPLSANPSQVREGGTALTKATGPGATTPGSFYWDFTNKLLYVDLGGASPTDADNLSISRTYGFSATNTTGVTITGFSVRQQNSIGVNLSGSSGATVSDVTASDAGSYGVSDSGGSHNLFRSVTATGNSSIGIRLLNTTNDTVDGGTVSNNGNHGVSAQGGSGVHITHVTATGNLKPGTRVAAGIDVSSSSLNALVEDNTSYGNDDSGIEIYTGSTGATVRRNVSYDNNDHGIDISNAANAQVLSITVVSNNSSGINVEGGSTGTTLRNNIAVDNTQIANRSHGDIRVDAQSVSGSSIDRDLVFESGGSPYAYEWNGVGYSSLNALQSATGEESKGQQADPKFADRAGRDFRLTADSPAIDSADSGVAGWANNDRLGNGPVDDPQVTDTGAGPTTYADLGAYELTNVPPPPVDAPPTAALTATPSQVTTGGSVILDASASTAGTGRTITSYRFLCGNGTTGSKLTTPTKSCTYSTAGSYTATVTVTNDLGQTAKAKAAVTVTTASKPTARLTVTPTTAHRGQAITADASASTGATSYSFKCGGQAQTAYSTSSTKTCKFWTSGTTTKKITVWVKNSAGLVSSTSKSVTVTP